jgi:hypothetical protein
MMTTADKAAPSITLTFFPMLATMRPTFIVPLTVDPSPTSNRRTMTPILARRSIAIGQ